MQKRVKRTWWLGHRTNPSPPPSRRGWWRGLRVCQMPSGSCSRLSCLSTRWTKCSRTCRVSVCRWSLLFFIFVNILTDLVNLTITAFRFQFWDTRSTWHVKNCGMFVIFCGKERNVIYNIFAIYIFCCVFYLHVMSFQVVHCIISWRQTGRYSVAVRQTGLLWFSICNGLFTFYSPIKSVPIPINQFFSSERQDAEARFTAIWARLKFKNPSGR